MTATLDIATAVETLAITKDTDKGAAIAAARDAGASVWEGRAVVEKFHGDDAFLLGAEAYEVVETEPNLLLTAGITALWNRLVGTGTAFDASNARVCVGDSSAAAAAGQTDLQASTNVLRKLVSAAPTVTGNKIEFVATFATGEANFAWNEVGVANAASGGALLNRLVSSLGTKTSASSWTLTLGVTLT